MWGRVLSCSVVLFQIPVCRCFVLSNHVRVLGILADLQSSIWVMMGVQGVLVGKLDMWDGRQGCDVGVDLSYS